MTFAKRLMSAAAIALLIAGFVSPVLQTTVHAQEDTSQAKTKKTPALREAIYEALIEAQEAGEAGNFDTALNALAKLERKKDLNSYEAANMHSFYAFIYFQKEDYASAIRSYENVLAQPDLPETMETQSIYALGQLYFTTENYPKAIEMLEKWFAKATNPGPEPYVFLSQAYYQQQRYREAVGPLDKAISIATERGNEIKENWLLLKRVYHYELKEYKKVAEILNTLIARFPKREYWNQLSAVYGETNEPERQLAVLELANMQGYLDRSQDLRNLAQLYMMNGVPLRGAEVLEKAINDGIVARDLANLRLLSQAWSSAREDDKALPILQEAARLSPDGKLDLRIAYSYMNSSDFDNAAEAVREAIRKGGLRNEGEARILLGTALFNGDKLGEAREVFNAANRDGVSKKRAKQWLTHISREEQRREMLREVKRQGQEQQKALEAKRAREG